ncbi:MAG: hypothetical protein COV69_03855 [Parcubacteria group bacterium CG11_big_fil_rev_8_21_14_0_20_39_14]|nr:MAG: hypothetical protein COV69_03855 [Parcubacteria group bacterium CG11_big_fil_rev_8_21_14_0_20_39_14]
MTIEQFNNRTIKNKGFTLVELLVSVALFGLTVAAASGLFSAALKAQRRSLETQKVLDNGRYVMETVAKALRMSEIVTSNGVQLLSLNVKNHAIKGTIIYTLENNRVKEDSSTKGADYISSSNVKVEKLYFDVSGVGTADNTQPRVTTVLKVKSLDSVGSMYQVELNFQTTVSQRNLDLP